MNLNFFITLVAFENSISLFPLFFFHLDVDSISQEGEIIFFQMLIYVMTKL